MSSLATSNILKSRIPVALLVQTWLFHNSNKLRGLSDKVSNNSSSKGKVEDNIELRWQQTCRTRAVVYNLLTGVNMETQEHLVQISSNSPQLRHSNNHNIAAFKALKILKDKVSTCSRTMTPWWSITKCRFWTIFPVSKSYSEKWRTLSRIEPSTFKAWATLTRMLNIRACQIQASTANTILL